jgi:hypothetical protein
MSRPISIPGDNRYWLAAGFGVGRGGSDLTYTAMASRSLCGREAVFLTTLAMDEPIRRRSGVTPVCNVSLICWMDQSPMAAGVIVGV